MMTTKITGSIRYIGTDDADLDLFESQYAVPDGISYNSYLIMDERVAIMDTVVHWPTDMPAMEALAETLLT